MRRALWVLMLAALFPTALFAGDRDFLYSYQSTVMDAGDKELESYTTYRFGRDHFFSGLDQSLEFETGLGGAAQISFYLNFTQELADDGTGTIVQSSPTLDGMATEFKFRLMDPSADAFGLGFLVEPEFEPDELDFETRLILDKNMGPWLWTLNLTWEPAYGWVDNQFAMKLTPSAGVGFNLSDRFFLGLEAQNENSYAPNSLQLEESTLSLGPVVNYSGKGWWAGLTILPQVANLMGPGLDLANSQRWQVRLGTSFDL